MEPTAPASYSSTSPGFSKPESPFAELKSLELPENPNPLANPDALKFSSTSEVPVPAVGEQVESPQAQIDALAAEAQAPQPEPIVSVLAAEKPKLDDNAIFDLLHSAQSDGTVDESLIQTVSKVAEAAGYGRREVQKDLNGIEHQVFVPTTEEGVEIDKEMRRAQGEVVPTTEEENTFSNREVKKLDAEIKSGNFAPVYEAHLQKGTIIQPEGEPPKPVDPVAERHLAMIAAAKLQAAENIPVLETAQSDNNVEPSVASSAEAELLKPADATAESEKQISSVIQETVPTTMQGVAESPVAVQPEAVQPSEITVLESDNSSEPAPVIDNEIPLVPTVSEPKITVEDVPVQVSNFPPKVEVEIPQQAEVLNLPVDENSAVTPEFQDTDQKIDALFKFVQKSDNPDKIGTGYDSGVQYGLLAYDPESKEYSPLSDKGKELLGLLKSPVSGENSEPKADNPVVVGPYSRILSPGKEPGTHEIKLDRASVFIPKPETPAVKPEKSKAKSSKKTVKDTNSQKAVRALNRLTSNLEKDKALSSSEATPEAKASAQETVDKLEKVPLSAEVSDLRERLIGSLDALIPGAPVESTSGSLTDNYLTVARSQLAAVRSRERTRLLSHKDTDRLHEAQGFYEEAFKAHLVEQMRFGLKEVEQLSPDERLEAETNLRTAAILMLTDEAHALSEAEMKVAENRPGAKFRKFYKDHPKLRIGIGVALAGAGIVGTATGVMPLAAIGLGGRALMSGVGTYISSRKAIGMAQAHHSRTGLRPRAKLEAEALNSLTMSNLYIRTAAMLSPGELTQEVSSRTKAKDLETVQHLDASIEAYVRDNAEKWAENGSGSTAELITKILSDRLAVESTQLDEDRRGNQKRTAAALVLGVGMAAVTAFIGVKKAEGSPVKLRDAVKPQRPRVSSEHVAKILPKAEISAGYSPDHIVKPGDSMWKISHDTLAAQDHDWVHLSARERLIKTDRLKDLILKQHGGKSLIMPGQHIKITWNMFKDAGAYKQ